MEQSSQSHDTIGSLVCLNRQRGHTRTSKQIIHKVLYNRYCLIKWAPMHEQVTMLQKLLSHIFEQYADIQDDGYISDEDIEE